MSIKGQSLGPPIRSDLSDPFRSNSFKTLKTEEYQSKIYELSNQVKILRQKLIQLEQEKQIDGIQPPVLQRNTELQKYVALLKEDNDTLRKENLLLRDKLKSLEAIVSKKKNGFNNQNKDKIELASVKSIKSLQYSPRTGRTSQLQGNINKNSMHLSSGNSVTTNLIRQLLAQCNEPHQGFVGKQKMPEKDEFYEFKNTQDCFQPFFSSLTKQLKLRVKRCLIKQKDLLYIDNNIQLGVISPYKISSRDPSNFTRLIIVLTNIGQYPLKKVTLQYIYSNDISLNGKKTNNPKFKTILEDQIGNNQQVKEQLDISINSIDFKCVKFTLSYQVGKQKYSQLLLLPISKSKLFRQMPFTSAPKVNQKIQRVFEYQKKILSQFSKLKAFFPLALQSKQKNGSPSISWKLQFMGRSFWVESFQIQQKLAISVTYQNQRALAQKIIEEYMFLFQKI